jgi:serine/threonine protein kinase
MKMFGDEAETMVSLSHNNIISIKDYDLKGIYERPNGSKKEVVYFALELADGGELFDMI